MTEKTHQIPVTVKVGWTKREAYRRVLPRVLLTDAPLFDVEASFTEECCWLSSTFNITIQGTRKNITSFVRVFDVLVGAAMA